MQTIETHGHIIEVDLRSFGAFAWLVMGFEVRVGGRVFHPKPDRVGFRTRTEFDFDTDNTRVRGVVRSLAPMWFLPRLGYVVEVEGKEVGRGVDWLRRWYLSYAAWLSVGMVLLLALLGVFTVVTAVRMHGGSNNSGTERMEQRPSGTPGQQD